MLKLTWKSWLAVLLGILLVFGGLSALISAQGQPKIAYWLGFAGMAIAALWSFFALVHWRDVPWVKRINTLVLATLGFGLLILLFLALDWEPGWTTALYCYLAVLGFLVGINLLRLILRPGHPVLGVARTMVEESLRMGVALIFIIAMLVLLPMLPLIFGSEDRVTYMVQRFLTYSNMIVAVLLGLMTVLLAARTVSLEIATRQIHMTLTKPLGRAQYLLGKWLGIILLNAVLLSVAGIATYGFTMAIAKNPALNALDRYAVDREVLTARLAKTPDPIDTTWQGMYANVLREKQLTDPTKFGDEGTSYAMLSAVARQEIAAETLGRFYSIDAGMSQDFLITGLGSAARAAERSVVEGQDLLVNEAGLTREQATEYVNAAIGRPNDLDMQAVQQVSTETRDKVMRILEREVIQLSLTPSTSPKPENLNSEVYLKVNGQPWPTPPAPTAPAPRTRLVNETPNELPVPAGLINNDGTMVLTITVPENREDGFEQESMRFNYKDNVIEVFYRVGSFEGNLFRALVIVWLKLAFLAMVGLMAGSLLSFPVAAMFSLIVLVAAAASGTINESLDSYASVARSDNTWEVITGTFSQFFSQLGAGDIYSAFKLCLRLIGEAFMLLIPSFGDFNTYQPLSDGHVISNGTVGNAAFKIGLIWTGVVAIIGLFLFNKKEIARVQV
ncbi:MAG: ABC transporter permease [Phycisphaeraceae bacterium]|jgi:ABC-type transport system involved in multi-copper enzyme maturation permease subunit